MRRSYLSNIYLTETFLNAFGTEIKIYHIKMFIYSFWLNELQPADGSSEYNVKRKQWILNNYDFACPKKDYLRVITKIYIKTCS